MTTSTRTPPATAEGSRLQHPRVLAVPASVAAALAVWAVAGPAAGVHLVAGAGGQPMRVGPVAVVVASLAASLAALGLLTLLERRTERARTVWTVGCLAVLVLSLAGPLSAATAAAGVALACMHLAVAAALLTAVLVPRRAR